MNGYDESKTKFDESAKSLSTDLAKQSDDIIHRQGERKQTKHFMIIALSSLQRKRRFEGFKS